MTRTLPEWIGKTDDAPVPPRVRVRVFDKFHGHCRLCTRKLFAGEWECDHIIAIVNGGENRERNLAPLCSSCHGRKTADDVFIKSKTYRTRSRHLGIRKRSSRPFPFGRNSRFKKKISGEIVPRYRNEAAE